MNDSSSLKFLIYATFSSVVEKLDDILETGDMDVNNNENKDEKIEIDKPEKVTEKENKEIEGVQGEK